VASPSSDPRIVCLVPSITELVCALGLAEQLVGRTGFCIHPWETVRTIPKVGGTKDVKLGRVRELAPTHVIVIPRLRDGAAPTGPAGLADADTGMVGRMVLVATRIADDLGLAAEGYRLVMNSGEAAGQTVFHLHLHILGGGRLGPVA